MYIPKEVIEKAIEGGWYGEYEIGEGDDGIGEKVWQVAALDPFFWQALGKALGWRKELLPAYWREKGGAGKMDSWILWAHRFYDIIFQGKDTTDFWKSLLEK